MNKKEIYALLYSPSQQAWHIETIEETEHKFYRSYSGGKKPADYQVVYIGESYKEVSDYRKVFHPEANYPKP